MNTKPILSLIGPFPPLKTGVADYTEQLLPALSTHYSLVLVIDDAIASNTHFNFPGEVVLASAFVNRPELHERVVYQIGNSPHHLYALDLLKIVPGCIVLHDFFLGNALAYAQWEQDQADAFLLPLIQSHGLSVLGNIANKGVDYCINHFPTNLDPINQALAIGVHSQYIETMAEEFYGSQVRTLFYPLAFPKELKNLPTQSERQALLIQHHFPIDAFIVASFGFGSPVKQHEVILDAWINSDLAKDHNSFLVFVGEYFSNAYLQQLQRRIPESLKARVIFTGFTSKEEYEQFLMMADLAIQLRQQSRGENSAAIMDCLASGIPVIVNDHGSTQEIPENVVWKIPHPSSTATLVNTLEFLYHHPQTRLKISTQARQYLLQEHCLSKTAESYAHMIESAVSFNQENLSKQPQPPVTSRQARKRQLLLDITDTAKLDKRTGIQRVVRSLLNALISTDSRQQADEIRPIRLDQQGQYRYANQYILEQYGVICPSFSDELIEVDTGDIYLDLDFNTITAVEQEEVYRGWRDKGVVVMHLVYDLLPLSNPQWFLPFMEGLYRNWLDSISKNSDVLVTISENVTQQLELFLDQNSALFEDHPHAKRPLVRHFHLGCDIQASFPSKGLPTEAVALLDKIKSEKTLLMVSTLEPRKAYEQCLDAFDLLWDQGLNINLVIVGKEGWHADGLVKRICDHPQQGQQLFWLKDISDEYLDRLYQSSSALLMASYGEGFGLPIVEAARNKLPVIARKIPVFKEIGGPYISYFEAHDGAQLAEYLQTWFALEPNQKPDIQQWQAITWNDSAQQVLGLIHVFTKRS